jgi:hypothetical protein
VPAGDVPNQPRDPSQSGNEIRIAPELMPYLERLAPGVIGYAIEYAHELWIPVIHAEKEHEGDVARYLDTLPLNRRVVIPNVINPVLAGMLERRGFTLRDVAMHDSAEDRAEAQLFGYDLGETVPAWIRDPRYVVDVKTDLV